MNRSSGLVNRSREWGINWGAVVLGWVVAVLVGLVISLILQGVYALVAEAPRAGQEAATAVLILTVLTGFAAYLVGGYVAGRRAGSAGGLNGAMTAVFGLIVGIVVAIILVILSLIAFGGEGLPTAPVGFGGVAEGAFLAVLLVFVANLLGGYLGGRLGEVGRDRPF
ncbi:MAG TPA: hypothetical protein VK869_04110 [Rubrobacteraceae bacterium]|nr:hypothetical protein [Rubrobacteraceae bacterium]